MSKRLKIEVSGRAGFLLVEALAALSIAIVVFVVLSQGFRMAQARACRPPETMWAMALARKVALGSQADWGSDDVAGFSYNTTIEPVTIEPRTDTLPPAPVSLSDGFGDAPELKAVAGLLRLVTVSVTGPCGREYRYETFRLKFKSNGK